MGITLQEGKEILEAMLNFSTKVKPGRPFSLAVVDAAGILVAFNRMDEDEEVVQIGIKAYQEILKRNKGK